ncbi:MAG TPA: hypothetical protein VE757_03090, partial [Gaiellaceae bacterium]|nr:hypothetical protein [Gaiellaceae bacterium]
MTTAPKRIGFLSFGAWHPAGGMTRTGRDDEDAAEHERGAGGEGSVVPRGLVADALSALLTELRVPCRRSTA